MIIDLSVELKVKESYLSPLDCVCESNGIILSGDGAILDYCARHILCAFSEENRLNVLRDFYRNARQYCFVNLRDDEKITCLKDIDQLIRTDIFDFLGIEQPTPEDWVRGVVRLIKIRT